MAGISTIKVGRVEAATSSQSNDSTMEINNHANTTVLGSDFLPIHDFERWVDVSRWYLSAGSVEFPTISGDIEYDYPISEQVYMLVYYQAIHCTRLKNHLMCPIQSLMAGVGINEIPKILA